MPCKHHNLVPVASQRPSKRGADLPRPARDYDLHQCTLAEDLCYPPFGAIMRPARLSATGSLRAAASYRLSVVTILNYPQ